MLEDFGEAEVCFAIAKVVNCCSTDCTQAQESLQALDLIMASIKQSNVAQDLMDLVDSIVPVPVLLGRIPLLGGIVRALRLAGLTMTIYSTSAAAGTSENEVRDLGEGLFKLINEYDLFRVLIDEILAKVCSKGN